MLKTDSDLLVEIDIRERSLAAQTPRVLMSLLKDRTTGKNIIWATDNYSHLGSKFEENQEITVASVTGKYGNLIQPRVMKAKSDQMARTKGKAEVFTPSWLCNEQNNLIDSAWFGRSEVFNRASNQSWKVTEGPIDFSKEAGRTWEDYVSDTRLEITCGEAPYLVSRYDTTNGELIPLSERIGLLDRKLRVVGENTTSEDDWLMWAIRAFQSTYGFEYQGDSLLLARENLLATYIDYMRVAINRTPSDLELEEIAEIVSWNIWQMDGLTGCVPGVDATVVQDDLTLFDTSEVPAGRVRCVIRDWQTNQALEFNSIAER